MSKKKQWLIVLGIYCIFLLFSLLQDLNVIRSKANNDDFLIPIFKQLYPNMFKKKWYEEIPLPENYYIEDRR